MNVHIRVCPADPRLIEEQVSQTNPNLVWCFNNELPASLNFQKISFVSGLWRTQVPLILLNVPVQLEGESVQQRLEYTHTDRQNRPNFKCVCVVCLVCVCVYTQNGPKCPIGVGKRGRRHTVQATDRSVCVCMRKFSRVLCAALCTSAGDLCLGG